MEFFKSLNIWNKRALAAFIGGTAGYAYYHYIGCASGTCAITSNPYISTIYGMVMGALLINSPTKNKSEDQNGTDNTTADQKI